MDDLAAAVPGPALSYAAGAGIGVVAANMHRVTGRYREDDEDRQGAPESTVVLGMAVEEYLEDDAAALAGYATGLAAGRMDWTDVRAQLES